MKAYLCCLLLPLSMISAQPLPTQRTLLIDSSPKPIEGTLYVPPDRVDALCIIIPGSGPVQRDGRFLGAKGGKPIYAEMAVHLAKRGIATFLYDKRWVRHLEYAHTFTEEDHLADLMATVDGLKKEIACNRVILLGHSEGGSLAVVLAGRRHDITCTIVAASAGFPIDELLLEQLASNVSLQKEVAELLRKMRDGSFPKKGVMLGASRDYWMQWMDFTTNMKEYIGKVACPILVVQGLKDASLPGTTLERNLAAWKSLADSREDMKVRVFPNVDHLLCDVKTSDLSGELVDAIAEFAIGTVGNPLSEQSSGRRSP